MNTKNLDDANNVLAAGGDVIKTRDDHELILIDKDGKVQNGDVCGWLPDNGIVNNTIFRSRIEPWLTSLFQSEHLSLLCGSGVTNAISYLAGASGGTTMGATTFTHFKDEINKQVAEGEKIIDIGKAARNARYISMLDKGFKSMEEG